MGRAMAYSPNLGWHDGSTFHKRRRLVADPREVLNVDKLREERSVQTRGFKDGVRDRASLGVEELLRAGGRDRSVGG